MKTNSQLSKNKSGVVFESIKAFNLVWRSMFRELVGKSLKTSVLSRIVLKLDAYINSTVNCQACCDKAVAAAVLLIAANVTLY